MLLSADIPQVSRDGVRATFAPHQLQPVQDAGLLDLAHETSALGRVTSEELARSLGRFLLYARDSFGASKA